MQVCDDYKCSFVHFNINLNRGSSVTIMIVIKCIYEREGVPKCKEVNEILIKTNGKGSFYKWTCKRPLLYNHKFQIYFKSIRNRMSCPFNLNDLSHEIYIKDTM